MIDIIGEVFLRAVILSMFFLGGVGVYFGFKEGMDREKREDTGVWKYRNWHFIFQCALLFGAAVVMTLWKQLFPES